MAKGHLTAVPQLQARNVSIGCLYEKPRFNRSTPAQTPANSADSNIAFPKGTGILAETSKRLKEPETQGNEVCGRMAAGHWVDILHRNKRCSQ